MFEAQATDVQQAIISDADRNVNDFRSGVNFLSTTHPGPIDQYREFFTRELGDLGATDPGVMVFEEVASDDLDELVEREHAIGNTSFEITLFPNPTSQKMITTRTTRDLELFGLRLWGLDVAIVRETLLPVGFKGEDFQLHVVDSKQLVDFAGGSVEETILSDLTAILIAGIIDSSGQFKGYAVKFDSLDDYLRVLDTEDLGGLNVELWADGIDRPVAQRVGDGGALPLADARLSSRESFETAGLQWNIIVWTSDDFGPTSSLFNQLTIWLTGISLSLIAAVGLAWRDRTNQRLDIAHVELAHVQQLAATDGLTGLLNRAGLIDAAREIPLAEPAALFFIDLDGFKTVNDESGHERGDSVLVEVAERLQSIFRKTDLVGRLGGDEFVVFTSRSDRPDAIDIISDRITTSIADLDPRITASLGVATRDRNAGSDVKEMLRRADEAMYEAKRDGGDRFRVRA